MGVQSTGYQRWLEEIRQGLAINASEVKANIEVIASTQDEAQREACVTIAKLRTEWLGDVGKRLVDQIQGLAERRKARWPVDGRGTEPEVVDGPDAAEPVPKRHQWDDLRDIAFFIERFKAMNSTDARLQGWSAHRVREIADTLEDVYEHSREH